MENQEQGEQKLHEVTEYGAIYVSEDNMKKQIRQEDLIHLRQFFKNLIKHKG